MAALLRLVCVFVLVAHAAAAGTTPCKGDCGPSDFPPRGVPSDRPLRRLEREYCINHTTCEACVSEEGCGWCNDGVNHTTGCVADDMASTCGWFDPNTCKLPEPPAPVTPPDEEPVAIPKPKEEAMDPYMLRRRAKFTPPPACNPWYHVACIKSAMAGYTQFKIKPAPDHCTEYQSCSSCLASEGCGWCGIDKDQGFCAAGSASGMNKLNCTLEVMAASGSYQPIPNPPDPYFAFWDAVEKGKAPPSGPRSRELKETCLGPAPKTVVPTTAALPTAAEVCGKGACRRDLGDDWAAKHVREFMSNFYDRLMCPLDKSEILPSEADLLNDTAVRNVGDYRLRDNTHMVSGHHHQILNGGVGVPMPQRPSIKLVARGNDRALVQINHTNSKKGEYFVFYKARGESKYKAQSCGGEQDSTMCVIDKLKPSACYSFRGALYDGDIRDQLWSGWTEYVPVRTCKSRAQFTMTAQATITFGGINRSEFNAKVNTTEKVMRFLTALKVDVSNYFSMNRREFQVTNVCWDCDSQGKKLSNASNATVDGPLRIGIIYKDDFCDTIKAMQFVRPHKMKSGQTIQQPRLELVFLKRDQNMTRLAIDDVVINYVDSNVPEFAPEQVPVPPVLTACDEAQGKVAAVERALAVEIYAQNNTGIIPALRRKVDIAKGEMQRVCLQVVLDKYGDKKWNKSGEIHGDLANKTVEHPVQQQQPEPDPPADASATINMEFAYVSSIRDKFDTAFSEDVAAVLGVTEFDVTVKTVLPGSVIVNFQVPTAESVATLAVAKIQTAKLSAVNKNGAPVTISGIQLVANETANNTNSSSRVFVTEANASTISKADRISKRLGNASDNDLKFVKQVRELQEEMENATVTKPVSRENVTAKREIAEKANSTRKAFQIEPDDMKEAPEQKSNITTRKPESSAERKLKAPLDRNPNMTTVEKKDAAAKAPVGTVPVSNRTRTPQQKSSNTSATSS